MFGRLLPKVIDNTYQGYRLAVWLLVPLLLVKLVMGINVAGLNPWIDNRKIAISADGIPLDSFGPHAASVVMFMFASWGLMLATLSLLGFLVLARYRAMIPLMYLLLAVEQFGRKAIGLANPILSAAKPEGPEVGVFINLAFMGVLAIGFALSLAQPRRTQVAAIT